VDEREIAAEIAEELVEVLGWDNRCNAYHQNLVINIFTAASERHGLTPDDAARITELVKFQLGGMLQEYRMAQGAEAAPQARVLN
jgi:hypothetical protein